jgi:Uma2 family endonuclease
MIELVARSMSIQEYLALPETNRIEELIDGELIVSPPPLDAHQEDLGRIHVFLAGKIPGGKLRIAPTGVYFNDLNYFEPDIFWISLNNDHCTLRPDGRFWQGAPDLIVEILSPSTAGYDRGVKFDIYEKYGVREYWLVDPQAKFMEVYVSRDGKFHRLGLFGVGKSFTSPVLENVTVTVETLLGQP